MAVVRRTKAFCTDSCRKAFHREADSGRQAEAVRLIGILARLGLMGAIWPIYRWDKSRRVYALLLPRHLALAEINLELRVLGFEAITDAGLLRAMRLKGIADYGHRVEADLISTFYKTRRDRRCR
jgi:hypothetical protein